MVFEAVFSLAKIAFGAYLMVFALKIYKTATL
jgi:hypothetical protein